MVVAVYLQIALSSDEAVFGGWENVSKKYDVDYQTQEVHQCFWALIYSVLSSLCSLDGLSGMRARDHIALEMKPARIGYTSSVYGQHLSKTVNQSGITCVWNMPVHR